MSLKWKRWLVAMTLMVSTVVSIATKAEPLAESKQLVRELSLTHHEFEDWTFSPKVNDKVLINNKSDIAHSIYITYPDGTVVNLGVQLPGETVTWNIPAAGDYRLQCWIHPVIRADMTVYP